MSIDRICSREVDTAEPDETVQAAAQRMHARKVGTLVVVNAAREPIGMITDRDLALRVIGAGGDPPRLTIREIMSPRPVTVHIDATINDALNTMRSHHCRRIPVVDGSGKLAGLLSLDDVLEVLAEQLQIIGGLIRMESPRSLSGAF